MSVRNLIPAVAYYRMSGSKQEASVGDQRVAVQVWAAKHGYVILREYVDEARPGWKEDRKAFQLLISDAAKGDFKAVLCWDQDRFSRFPVLEANHYWYLLDRAGVHLATVGQGLIDWKTLGGWLTASVAQHGKAEYCRDLARNTSRGLRKRKLAGHWVGKAPLGYDLVKGTGRLIPGDEEAVRTVRAIFQLRGDGHGYAAIAKHLNKQGIPTPRGRQWSQHTIVHILQREAYLGHTVIGKWSRAKYERLTSEVVTIEDTHAPLVDRALWDRCHAIDASASKWKGHWKGDGEGGALGGLLYCECGHVMYHTHFRDEWAKYICGAYHRSGTCGCRWVEAGAMLEVVAAKIREKFLLGDRRQLVAAIETELDKQAAQVTTGTHDGMTKQIRAIDAKIATATERLVTVANALVPAVEAKLLELQAQRDGLVKQLAATEIAAERPKAKDVAKHLFALDDVLKHGRPSEVRLALSQFVGRIDVRFRATGETERRRRMYLPTGASIVLSNDGQHSGTWCC